MDLREVDPGDRDARAAWLEIHEACRLVDAPWNPGVSAARLEAQMRHGWDGEPGRFFLATQDGDAVASLVVHLSELDNRDLAWLDVRVRPDVRRRGHGRALWTAALGVVRDAGRTLVGAYGWDVEATSAFAASVGAERRSQAIQRRQTLADLPAGDLEDLLSQARAASCAYDVKRVVGPLPEDLLEPVSEAALAINDAPKDDLELEDDVITVERCRAYDEAMVASGFELHRLLARHRDSGELAGLSVVAVDREDPRWGDQHDTSVVRGHRGHRLGLRLKAEMVAWLREVEPQLAWVDTWNAESNDHMIAVNEQLGYRVLGREVQFQLRLSQDPSAP